MVLYNQTEELAEHVGLEEEAEEVAVEVP